MTRLTLSAFLWIGASSTVHAFLESPTTSFVQDMYGKASIYHQKKRIETEDSRNQVVNFLSDIYGLASSTPYSHSKRETSSLDPPSSHRHVLSAKMMNDPYGVVASTRDHHAGGLLEPEDKPRAIQNSYVLPTDHGNNVVFDLNAQRQALEAQFQRPSAEPPVVVVSQRPSLVLPTDINGNTVVFDMQQQLNAIQAQFIMPQQPQQQEHYHAETALPATPQVIMAQSSSPPAIQDHPSPPAVQDHTQMMEHPDLQQLEEHSKLLEQQELAVFDDQAAVLH